MCIYVYILHPLFDVQYVYIMKMQHGSNLYCTDQ